MICICMVDGKSIRLRDDIPEGVRTPGKDECAAWIQQHMVEAGVELPKTQISEGSGWSRQHISNTLRDYFVEDSGESPHHDFLDEYEDLEDQRETSEFDRSDLMARDNDETVAISVERLIEMTQESYRKGLQDGQQMRG